MSSADGRYVIVFNGEIYNHLDVRQMLAREGRAPDWRGHSDTETIVAAVSAWGIAQTLPRLRGMFAFAVWDNARRRLVLARDRIGEKPLYYGWLGGDFVFGSELKALRCHPAWTGEIDRGALTLFMRYGHVPAPNCIFSGFRQLAPGKLLHLDANHHEPTIESYWTLAETIAGAKQTPFEGSGKDAVDALHDMLSDAVAEQMVADVPYGAFLSGGIDSSTVVSLMQARSSRPIRTFTIGFDEREHDEAAHAKAVARHLGTDHTELYIRPEEALATVRDLAHVYDEPFADSSALPTTLLARLTSAHVTVALSGDGGDELFGGYRRYEQAQNLVDRIDKVPAGLRRALGHGLGAVSERTWDSLLRPTLAIAGGRRRHLRPGQKVHKWADYLRHDRITTYHHLMSSADQPTALVLDGVEPATVYDDVTLRHPDLSFREEMMALDALSYLPDDILVKVDRAAMSVGLETRIPLLDERIVRFAWTLPDNIRSCEGRSKWPLRKVLDRYVPATLVERPKQGFSVPIAKWLRGPLRPWAESLLDRRSIRERGLLAPDAIGETWSWFLADHDETAPMMWNLLMFQSWLEASSSHTTVSPAETYKNQGSPCP